MEWEEYHFLNTFSPLASLLGTYIFSLHHPNSQKDAIAPAYRWQIWGSRSIYPPLLLKDHVSDHVLHHFGAVWGNWCGSAVCLVVSIVRWEEWSRKHLWGHGRRLSMFGGNVGSSWQCDYRSVYTTGEKKIVGGWRETRYWWATWDNVNKKQDHFVKITSLVLFIGWLAEDVWKGLEVPSTFLIWERETEW